MTMTLKPGFSGFLLLLIADLSFADMSSTNYSAANGYVSGGGGNAAASSNYGVDEGSIDHVAKESLSSTNYGVEGMIGASHNLKVPVIQAVAPAGPSRFFTDQSPSYTVTASNPGTGTLQYQVKEGGTVKAAWQGGSALSYSVTASDKGRHDLLVQVKNNEGTTAASNVQYLFRRPVK